MIRRGVRMLAPVALLLIAAGSFGCTRSAGGGGTDAAADRGEVGAARCADAAPDPSATPCQGTINASGTTPIGPFSATSVSVYANCSTVPVSLFDSCSAASLTLVLPGSADAGLGQQSVRANLIQPSSQTVIVTTATVDLSEHGAPPGGGGGSGQAGDRWTGTFTLDQDGFSVSGSFSSPTCGSQCQK